MTSPKSEIALVLIPAAVVAYQSISIKEDFKELQQQQKQDPIRNFIKETKNLVGLQESSITKLDAAVPLIIIGGLAFPKFTTFLGCSYAIGRQLYTSRSEDREVIKGGEGAMRLSLLALTITAAVSGVKFFLSQR